MITTTFLVWIVATFGLPAPHIDVIRLNYWDLEDCRRHEIHLIGQFETFCQEIEK